MAESVAVVGVVMAGNRSRVVVIRPTGNRRADPGRVCSWGGGWAGRARRRSGRLRVRRRGRRGLARADDLRPRRVGVLLGRQVAEELLALLRGDRTLRDET